MFDVVRDGVREQLGEGQSIPLGTNSTFEHEIRGLRDTRPHLPCRELCPSPGTTPAMLPAHVPRHVPATREHELSA